MSNKIVIKKVNSVFDIFFGEEGFDQKHWTRMAVVKTQNGNFLKYLKGAQMPARDMMEVRKMLGV